MGLFYANLTISGASRESIVARTRPVAAPDGHLIIRPGSFQIDLVEWHDDPLGGMRAVVIGSGQGGWVVLRP